MIGTARPREKGAEGGLEPRPRPPATSAPSKGTRPVLMIAECSPASKSGPAPDALLTPRKIQSTETEVGCEGVPSRNDGSASGDWNQGWAERPEDDFFTDGDSRVWESETKQEGRFRVKLRLISLRDRGDERKKCVQWLSFGGEPSREPAGG